MPESSIFSRAGRPCSPRAPKGFGFRKTEAPGRSSADGRFRPGRFSEPPMDHLGGRHRSGRDPRRAVEARWRRVDPKGIPGPSIRSHYLAIAFDPDGNLHVTTARDQTVPMRQSFDGRRGPPEKPGLLGVGLPLQVGREFWLAHCCCEATGCSLQSIRDGVSTYDLPRNLRISHSTTTGMFGRLPTTTSRVTRWGSGSGTR